MRVLECIGIATAMYIATSLPIAIGFLTGTEISGFRRESPAHWTEHLIRGSTVRRNRIVNEGYSYDPYGQSDVASFPVFPMIARGVARATGMRSVLSMLVISNLSLLVATCVTLAYFRLRQGDDGATTNRVAILGVMALLTTPCGFFFACRIQNRCSWRYWPPFWLGSRAVGR